MGPDGGVTCQENPSLWASPMQKDKGEKDLLIYRRVGGCFGETGKYF